ncbi:MAG: tetratricopeptide repeat protein [Phycisphaerales bacterium]
MRTTPLLAIALIALTGLAGCKGHGKYTKEGKEIAERRMAELKSMNEYQQADQAFRSGDLKKARKYIERCLAINPALDIAHVLHGRILLEQGDLDKAAAAFSEAEQIKPENVDAQYYLGNLYERFNQPEQALARYTRAAELDPASAQYAVAAAETFMDMGRLTEAEHFLTKREGTENFLHNAGVRQTLGHIAMMRGDAESACTLFDEARLLAPDDNGVLEDLVRSQLSTGRWGEAEFNINRLLKMEGGKDRRDLRHMKARCLVQLDRPVEARTVLLDLTSDDAGQKDVEAWVLLGNTAYVLRDMNRVRMSFTRVVALAPERADGYMLRALWQRKQRDMNAALISVERACERAGREVEPFMLKGVILKEMGRMPEARAAFEAALSLDPQNEQARKAVTAVPTGE